MSESMSADGLRYHVEPETPSGADRRSRESAPAALDWCRLADWCARLGPVLWLHRADADRAFPRARSCANGVLLLDHPALAAFAGSAAVEAHSTITPHGPREWLEFVDVRGDRVARLYLLPDADYVAWDAMLGDCAIARIAAQTPPRWRAHAAFMRCALRRLHGSWCARAVRFPLMRLPCLHVLGLRAPLAMSDLGRQLVAAIANDERATLQSA